jgi:peptide/nickel transport system permease protein
MSSNQAIIEVDAATVTAPEGPVQKPGKTRRPANPALLVLQNRKATAGAIILLFFIILAVFAPWIAPHDPTDYVGPARQGPSSEFWFGTTGSGQDVLSQTIWGTRISLGTGLLVGFLTTMIGALIGMSAGYFGGRVDDALSLFTNVVLIIPSIPLLIVLAAFMPAGFFSIVGVLTLTGWAWGARVLRSQTMSLREKDFVSSAVVSGESSMRIIFREIFPNMISIVVAGMFGAINYAIGAQAGLEFLGLGNPSAVSWGTNLYWAQNNGGLLTGSWWTIIPSGICIALVAFSFAMLNFAIDEVTNPRLRSQRQTVEILKRQPRQIRTSRATPVIRRTAGA